MNRRRCIQALLGVCAFLAVPWRAWAGRNQPAFSSDNMQEALHALTDGRDWQPSDHIEITMEQRIENGAFVPIKVRADFPSVQRISIFVEKNPNPLIASFSLTPACNGFVATRIKIDMPSKVLVLAETADGIYGKDTFVEVLKGGCSCLGSSEPLDQIS